MFHVEHARLGSKAQKEGYGSEFSTGLPSK
jgi:hypothetical protein